MGSSAYLDEIVLALGSDPENPNTDPINRDEVLEWMSTTDIESMGALFYLITDSRHYPRIQPPLEFNHYHSFVKAYYEKCLIENPDGEWSDSRYTAGWSFVNWFKGIWDDPNIPKLVLADYKEWLSKLYLGGNDKLRNCIVTAILEHLFDNQEIKKYFLDWKKDKRLNAAFSEATE